MRRLVTTRKLPIDLSSARGAGLLLVAAACFGAALLPASASAQCVVTPPNATCTGASNGFDAGALDDLIVDIQTGAVITSTDPTEGLKLNSGNQVDSLGTIDVTGAGAIGVDFQSGTGNVLNNGAVGDSTPAINVTGANAIGILDAGAALGGNPGVVIHNHGQIGVSGSDAVGIQAGENAFITNEAGGVIDITGAGQIGISTGLKNQGWVDSGNILLDPHVRNFGTISVGADGATGISVGDGMQVANEVGGIITVGGAGSVGIAGGNNSAMENLATINVDGAGAIGIDTGNWIEPAPGSNAADWNEFVITRGPLNVDGDGAIGIRVGDGWSTPGNLNVLNVISGGALRVRGIGAKGFEVGDDVELYHGRPLTPPITIITGSGSVGYDMGLNGRFVNEGIISVNAPGANILRIGANDGADPGFVAITNSYQMLGGLPDPAASHGPLIVFEQPAQAMPGVNRLVNLDIRSFPFRSIIEASLDGVAVQGTNPIGGVGGVEVITNEFGAWIHGDLDLLDGDDVVENLGGIITGDILLGDGADRYSTKPAGQLARTIDDPSNPGTDLTLLGFVDGGAGWDTVDLLDGTNIGLFRIGQISRIEQIDIHDAGRWILSGASDSSLEDLNILSGGTLTWSNPIDSETGLVFAAPSIQGDITFASDANLLIRLEPDNPDSPATPNLFRSTPIAANGQAFLDGTAELVIAGANDDLLFQLLRDDVVEIAVIDAASLSGRFSDVAPPASIYRIETAYDDAAGTMDLFLQFLSFTDAAATPNQYAVATNLDEVIRDVNSGALADLMNALLTLDDDQLVAAFDQLHPEAYDAQTSAMLSMGNRVARTMLERPRMCIAGSGASRRDPITGLVCRERKWEPWVEGWGQIRTLTGDVGHISHKDSGGGGVFGVDHRVSPSLRLTGTIGAATSSVDVTDVGYGTVNTIDTGLSTSWRRSALRVQGVFSYSYGSNQMSRAIDIPGFQRTTDTSYSSHRIGVRAEADYVFDLSGWSLAPLASIDYTALIRDGLQEVGAGQAGLLLDGNTDSIVTIRAGFQLAPTFKKDDYWTEFLEFTDGVWRPHLGLNWRQVVAGNDRDLTARFIGADPNVADFTVSGDDAGQGFELNAGFEFTPKRANRVTLGVFYEGFLWTDVQSNYVGANLQLAF